MNFKHYRLPLKTIDFTDETFCLSFPCRSLDLLNSIDLVGIIHPPVVRKNRKKYQIVCGRGRLRAAKRLGLQRVMCKVLPAWVDDLSCLMIAFEENITTRGFNIIEQALVIEKFLHYLSEEKVIEDILPRLGYSPAYKNLEFLLKLNFLEDEVKTLVCEEIIQPQLAIRLLDLEEADRQAIARLLVTLRPGANRQRQILEILQDLSRKEEVPIYQILKEPGIEEILNHEKLNPPQKTEKLYSYLRKRLFPRLVAQEEAFRKWADSLSGAGMRVIPSQAFEKDTYFLQIEFTDSQDLYKKWQKLGEKLKN